MAVRYRASTKVRHVVTRLGSAREAQHGYWKDRGKHYGRWETNTARDTVLKSFIQLSSEWAADMVVVEGIGKLVRLYILAHLQPPLQPLAQA